MVVGRHRGVVGKAAIACQDATSGFLQKGNIMEEAFTPPGRGLLADLVAVTIPLRPFPADGDRQRGSCPFHADPTQRLYVNCRTWYCFGCHCGGDAVQWIMRRDGVDRDQAIAALQRNSDWR